MIMIMIQGRAGGDARRARPGSDPDVVLVTAPAGQAHGWPPALPRSPELPPGDQLDVGAATGRSRSDGRSKSGHRRGRPLPWRLLELQRGALQRAGSHQLVAELHRVRHHSGQPPTGSRTTLTRRCRPAVGPRRPRSGLSRARNHRHRFTHPSSSDGRGLVGWPIADHPADKSTDLAPREDAGDSREPPSAPGPRRPPRWSSVPRRACWPLACTPCACWLPTWPHLETSTIVIGLALAAIAPAPDRRAGWRTPSRRGSGDPLLAVSGVAVAATPFAVGRPA